MDYEQALEWVHSLPRLAAHPGVENTRRLLEKLGKSGKKPPVRACCGNQRRGQRNGNAGFCAAQGGDTAWAPASAPMCWNFANVFCWTEK